MADPTSQRAPAVEGGEPSSLPGRARPATTHQWRFHRTGGLDQVMLETGADLAHLAQLDPKLWVALSCPTKGLEIDERTLALLDADRDGYVRVAEVLAAVGWCAQRLDDLGILIPGADALPLSAISTETPEGKALLGGARHVLEALGKGAASEITTADVADTTKVFDATLFNGDGIVPADAADSEPARQLIAEIIDCVGAVPDRSGKPGIDQARLDRFFEELQKFVAWWADGSATEGAMPLGADTPAAWEAYRAVEAKVNDYFARCGLASLDARAVVALNRTEAEWAALAGKNLAIATADMSEFPLARIEAGRPLPLLDGVNPAWAAPLARLQRLTVAPLLGADTRALTLEQWARIQEVLAIHGAWQGRKAGAAVEKLGLLRAQAILAGDGKRAVAALLDKDRALEAEAAAVTDAVRMVHYRRDLVRLLRNFVTFDDFYDRSVKAIFQVGTLYLDSRGCDLCIRVDDPAAHATLGSLSRMFIAYCDCRRAGEQMKIAACFTQGDSDYLMVGRNGVFVDRKGRDWNATITKIVENPISVRQAFFAPYKKVLKLIEEQAQKFAASKAKAADDRLASGVATTTGAATAGKPPKPPDAVDVGKMVGIIAALGVGIGALGTLFGGFVSGFMNLQPWWSKLVAVAGVVLLISGPSMAIAWLKLRQRTLGPLLDAAGWAINGRVKVSLPLGFHLTSRATLPPGARRTLGDPYANRGAKRARRLGVAIAIVVVALAVARALHRWPFGR